MVGGSRIGWCDTTVNWITGCTPVSSGCDFCYADRLAKRRFGEWATRNFSCIQFHPERIIKLRLGKKPRRVFANSMYDIGHELVQREWLTQILDVVKSNKSHTFIFLTKRPENLCREDWEGLDNVVLGVSIENNVHLDRLQYFKDWKVKRMVSFEPLIGRVKLPPGLLKSSVDWVIVGVESGRGCRQCEFHWINGIVEAADADGVPVYVKEIPKKYDFEPQELEYLQSRKSFAN